MNPRDPERPADASPGVVAGLWPHLGCQDPGQPDLDRAYGEVVTNRAFKPESGEWEAIPSPGTRALLRITCVPESHLGGEVPMLAEVWKTSYGLLFISNVRILLDGSTAAPLWVKCPDHGSAEVDLLKLNQVYEQDQEHRRGIDMPEPVVMRLHDVVALSADLYQSCACR